MNSSNQCRPAASRLRATLACAAAAIGLLIAFTAASAHAATITFTTPGERGLNVPAGVTSMHVVAVGGSGGAGGNDPGPGGSGGAGAVASADVPVSPGQLIFVEVASNGSNANVETGGAGGNNGGADGGNSSGGTNCHAGGGGGGASDLRTSRYTEPGSLASRLVAAGGGGGGGGATFGTGSFGGNGGSSGSSGSGTPGASGHYTMTGAGSGGGGATPTTQGTGGAGGGPAVTTGGDGSLGAGGSGGASDLNQCAGSGGGGGGGAFGGGGGGASFDGGADGGGGGGGSSAFATQTTNRSVAGDTTGTPSVTLTYTPNPTAPGTKKKARCVVPKLKGKSLKKSNKRLK